MPVGNLTTGSSEVMDPAGRVSTPQNDEMAMQATATKLIDMTSPTGKGSVSADADDGLDTNATPMPRTEAVGLPESTHPNSTQIASPEY